MATETAKGRPLAALLKRHDLKPKTWRDLVESGLMEPATARIPGSKSYALTADQAKRLAEIATTKRRLKKRYTLSSLAFELALRGDRSQPALVKHEIAKRVRTFWGILTRGLQRSVGLKADYMLVTDTDIHTAAKLIAKRLSKRASKRDRPSIRDALQIISYILLSMTYNRRTDPLLGSSHSIKELLLSIASFNDKELGWIGMERSVARGLATQLVFMLADTRDAFSLDEKRNPVFRALQEIPDTKFWKLFEVWPQIMTVYWSAFDRLKKSISIPEIDDDMRTHFNAVFLGSLIAYYKTGSPEVYDEFYVGSCDAFATLVDRIVGLVEIAVTARKLMSTRRSA